MGNIQKVLLQGPFGSEWNNLAKVQRARTPAVAANAFTMQTSHGTLIKPKPPIGNSNQTGFFPFRLYATGDVDGSGNIGYQVRSGFVDVRPLFHQFLSVGQPGFAASFSFGNYSTPFIPDNCDGAATPDTNAIISPPMFFLDPTVENILGVDWGAYYAFWVRITPDTDNAGLYDGTVSIQYHRFTAQTAASIYDGYVFPSLPDANGYEYLPIAVLQLKAATNALLGVDSKDGDIYQLKRDNFLGRFPAGQNGLNGFNWQGAWIEPSPDPLISSGNRYYYPGDFIYYYTGTPGDVFNGHYVWIGSPGSVGAGGNPASAGSFEHIAQFG